MSVADAAFLYLERPEAPLHIGAVVVVEGRVGPQELADRIWKRLPRMPRYAQKVSTAPLSLARPCWEDVPDFDVRSHVHRWALPAPGGWEELLEAAAQLLAQPLNPHRPLWDFHVLEGLEDERSALFLKVHHCMGDGASGVQLLQEICDPVPATRGPQRRARPQPAVPRFWDRVGSAVRDEWDRQLRRRQRALKSASEPDGARRFLERWGLGTQSLLRTAHSQVPELPWNVPLGPSRQLSFTRLPLSDVRRIRGHLGGTVNDVVLSVLAGGFQRYLSALGLARRAEQLSALVPISLRASAPASGMGNEISGMLVPLPIAAADEVERIAEMQRLTDALKDQRAWSGIDLMLDVLDALPPPMFAALGRSLQLGRVANLIATNVRGPGEPLYLCGQKIEAVYPIVPIADNLGLGVAVFSYAGWLYVGLNADADHVPELDKLRQAIEQSFDELSRDTSPASRRNKP